MGGAHGESLSGPSCDLVRASQRLGDSQADLALQKLLAAQKLNGLPPAAAEYLGNRVAEKQAVIAFEKAPWQPFLRLPMISRAGKRGPANRRVESPGLLEAKTEKTGALLTRLEPVGDTWELRGEFQLTTKRAGRVEAVIFCGPPGDLERHGFSLRFFARRRGSSGISLARGWRDGAVSKWTDFKDTSFPFTIRLENRRLRVRANGGQWYADQPLPEGAVIDKGALLSLGATGGLERTVQFRKLEWRTAGKTE